MPTGFLNADVSFPQFRPEQSADEKIDSVASYLFMLLEQLRYSLNNLGQENFNENSLKDIANIITEPVYIQLADDEGNIASVMSQVTSLSSTVESHDGSISQLTQTANSLTSRIGTAEGNISTVTQTVSGLTIDVSTVEKVSTIKIMSNGIQIGSSGTIDFTGLVTFYSLVTPGSTVINGENITTGTINCDLLNGGEINGQTIKGGTITGSVFRSILQNPQYGQTYGDISGRLEFYYLGTDASSLEAAEIRLDDQGTGSASDAQYRLFISTKTARVGGTNRVFNMKLESAGGISLTAANLIYVESDSYTTIRSTGDHINLRPGSGKYVYIYVGTTGYTLPDYIRAVVNGTIS